MLVGQVNYYCYACKLFVLLGSGKAHPLSSTTLFTIVTMILNEKTLCEIILRNKMSFENPLLSHGVALHGHLVSSLNGNTAKRGAWVYEHLWVKIINYESNNIRSLFVIHQGDQT